LGSNIANVLLILGISATIRPISLSLDVIRRDIFVMIAASTLLWILAIDGEISGYDGAVLMVLAIGYLAFSVNAGLSESKATRKHYETDVIDALDISKSTRRSWKVYGLQLILSLIILVIGANLVVSGAISLAHSIGISEFIIALTIVSVGTSLPEITASSLASARNNGEIAVGNVIGSNM
jgi:cation:H+ antiporter